MGVNGDIYVENGWLRVSGQRGIYFQDYGGGFYMTDATWIRTYNNKNFYHNSGIMRTDGIFQVGSNGNRFIVNSSGNVGIGTTGPDCKLDVNGKIRAEEIEIITDVPAADYVFETDYRLISLMEVETFIQNNKHLPDIPSALEIDYIRIYRRRNPTRDVPICTLDPNESSAITGRTITIGGSSCNPVIENNKSLFLVANESITLLPGFWSKNGSNFVATTNAVGSSLKSSNSIMIDDNTISSVILNKSISFKEGDYRIFPNPTVGQFTIENYDEINVIQKIEIIDLNGRLIYQYNGISKSVLVDLSNQPKGIYIIRIYKKDTEFVNKIIYQ